MVARLQQWCEDVKSMENLVENKAHDILTWMKGLNMLCNLYIVRNIMFVAFVSLQQVFVAACNRRYREIIIEVIICVLWFRFCYVLFDCNVKWLQGIYVKKFVLILAKIIWRRMPFSRGQPPACRWCTGYLRPVYTYYHCCLVCVCNHHN